MAFCIEARNALEANGTPYKLRFREMTGLSFDVDGRCTTPGDVKIEGAVKSAGQNYANSSAQIRIQKRADNCGKGPASLSVAQQQPKANQDFRNEPYLYSDCVQSTFFTGVFSVPSDRQLIAEQGA
jgi:hypothetical protein